MLLKIVFVVALVGRLAAAPSRTKQQGELADPQPPRVLYDESQEGKWNVRADLKNFVVLIIPTKSSTPSSSSPGAGGLLDFFRKTHHSKHQTPYDDTKKSHDHDVSDTPQETQHFIESKTAPYHVDISSTSEKMGDDVIIANSPAIALVKGNPEGQALKTALARARRFAKAVVFTVPADEEFVLTKTEEAKKVVKKDNVKKEIYKQKVNKTEPKQEIKLLGAELEQCGPGMSRDSYGNCRVDDIDNI